ncbi:MAG: hypothetical protein Q7T13_01675 [Polaromonas sp.]|nr:hypothetical protein [Polaromonas sp.]
MPVFDTSAWGTAETDVTAPQVTPKARSSFTDTLGAKWDQESVYVASKVRPTLEYPDDHSFDYKSYDKGYWGFLAAARNKDHAEDMISQFKREQENKKVLDNASWVTELGTEILVGATNPLNYLGLGGAATVGKAALKGAGGAMLGTALTEPILQSNQIDRSAMDSLTNIAGAAVGGAVLGGAGKMISNKLGNGGFMANETPVLQGTQNTYTPAGVQNTGSVGAAGVTGPVDRSMADSKLQSIPFLPKSWTEPITRFALPFARSANQRLSTSSLESVRNAQNILLRTSLATTENANGVANQVPIEVAVGQRAGDLYTKLIETDKNLREAWWKKVEGGTYDGQAILADLRVMDPNLPENYKLNRTSFDKVLKMYMADDKSIGSQMEEVVQRVAGASKMRADLDAEKIDLGLAKNSQLEDIITGEKIIDPTKSVDYAMLGELKKQRAEMNAELEALKSSRTSKGRLNAAEKAERKTLEDKIAGHDKAIEAKAAAVKDAQDAYDSLIPSSKTHRFSYEDGAHYLSRVFDKGRIMGDREGFIDDLVKGWAARNPELDLTDVYTKADLEQAARQVSNKLLNEENTVSLGELLKSLDLPGKYTKDRTLNVDDKFLTNWTHDDVLATEMFHISQATVDVELARAGVKFDDLIYRIQLEAQDRINDLNAEFGAGSKKAASAISKLLKERDRDIAELEYAMRRLKRQSPGSSNPTVTSFNEWTSRFNKLSGMAMLGSSALPNSLGDIGSVARALGTGRTYKIIGQFFNKEVRDDIIANAKQMGVLSELVDRAVRQAHMGDELADSLNPNKGLKGPALQKFDRGLNTAADLFSRYSLIDAWSRAGRVVASTASTQHIIESAAKGWKNLSDTTRADLAKFYIDEDMLERIAVQSSKHSDDVQGVKFAALEKWDDAEAARVFKASVYAHTEYALNIPSIGTGSTIMSENFLGRMYTRFKSFNNASHESTFLSSLQNREASRVVTGVLNYALWGFLGTAAYDYLSGRPCDWETYFGDSDAMTKTAWKALTKGGYVAAASDAFVSVSKALGSDKLGVVSEAWRSVMPESLEKELFPKFEKLSAIEKAAGPTYSYVLKGYEAGTGFLDGAADEKDVGNVRSLLPGQNIGWLRRGLDYVEEALGGRDADRNMK